MAHEVTQLLASIERGEHHAANELLPLVYDELRRLAAARMAHESAGQTLDATALVHEAYVRLVDTPSENGSRWEGRSHFFAAAAEAMRRILVEQARRKRRIKHGGDIVRVELDDPADQDDGLWDRIVEVDAALSKLADEDPVAADVVKLHYFTGLSMDEIGSLLKMSRASAYRQWTYARSWLKAEIDR
jgi:RNA polymerase sigma factor (TIGR02999 family)